MSILTLNAGSSSLRFALFDEKLRPLYRAHIDAIGQPHCQYRRMHTDGKETRRKMNIRNHKEAIATALTQLQLDGAIQHLYDIKTVAHRVVHGGERFKEATKITPFVMRHIEKLSPLAPQHNPANSAGIQAAKKLIFKATHYAVFDTAFHSTLPEQAYLYGLPYSLYKKEKIRRYGFHGTSHKYVDAVARKTLRKKSARVITCHMGNGVSLAAIKGGVCLDTTMGFTPLEGPLMGSRSGSIDPAIIFHLVDKKRSLEDVAELLEHESGFKGLSGISSDVRKLRARLESKGTQRAFGVFSYQMAKHILSLSAALGKVDALVFTAGIGEHANYLRERIVSHLRPHGYELNKKANAAHELLISSKQSQVKIFVIHTDEEKQMASEVI